MAHDRTADQEQPRETDRPQEVPPQQDDLDARLEHLPAGHPSSPYRDDGSRRPSPPDLAEHDFSLPGDAPDLPPTDRARTAPDGSWHWKAHDLSPAQSRAGDQGLARCHEREGRDAEGNYGEHGLTPAMRHIEAQLEHGHLAPNTEQFALKEPDRYKEKLAKLIARFPGESPEDLTRLIHDGVRYTFVSTTEAYLSNLGDVSRRLQEGGFELMARINNWGEEEYKGMNMRWRDSDSDLISRFKFTPTRAWAPKSRHTKRMRELMTSEHPSRRLRACERIRSTSAHRSQSHMAGRTFLNTAGKINDG